MAANIGGPTSLVGKTFDCAFGAFVPRLTVLSPTELRVQATIGATEIDEVVKSDPIASEWLSRNAKPWLGESAELQSK